MSEATTATTVFKFWLFLILNNWIRTSFVLPINDRFFFLQDLVHSQIYYHCNYLYIILLIKTEDPMGHWCGSVGKAIASDSRGPRFELVIGKPFITYLLSTVQKRRKKNKKRPGRAIFKKTDDLLSQEPNLRPQDGQRPDYV